MNSMASRIMRANYDKARLVSHIMVVSDVRVGEQEPPTPRRPKILPPEVLHLLALKLETEEKEKAIMKSAGPKPKFKYRLAPPHPPRKKGEHVSEEEKEARRYEFPCDRTTTRMPKHRERRQAAAEYFMERLTWHEDYAYYMKRRKEVEELLNVGVITKCTQLPYQRSE